MRRSGCALLFVLAAALGACGGGDGGGEAAPPDEPAYLESDGPLGAPFLMRKRAGGLEEPTTVFNSSTEEANALISIRDHVPRGSSLQIAWYRLKADGSRQHLFSHVLKVEGRGHARSQALAQGGLTPGVYETVATLGSRRTRTPWIVVEQAAKTRVLSAVAAGAGGDLVAGESRFDALDAVAPRGSPEPARNDTACEPSVLLETLLEVTITTRWTDRCKRLTVAAAVTGPPQTLRTIVVEEQRNELGVPQHWFTVSRHFCAISGGSDLPGTPVTAVVTDSGGATARDRQTLGDMGPLLQAGIETRPTAGSRVEPGDRIALIAVALLLPPALGVRTLYVDANDELVEATSNRAGGGPPAACDPGRLVAVLLTEYRVPADASGVTRLCANAVGFDGTEAPPSCADFYTGEVWMGTLDITATSNPNSSTQCPNPVPLTGTVRLVVAGDGTVHGQYTVEGCGVSEPTAEWTGRATGDSFHFPELVVFTNGQPIPKVSETEARATLSNFQGAGGVGTQWVTTWNLRCMSC